MSEYGEGVRTGYSTVSQANPFSAYIKRVDEARARQLADQKDVQELKSLFAQLEKKHEYDTKVEEQKRQIGLELEKEKGVQDRMNKLAEGYTFDEAGNETPPIKQTSQAVEQAQPVDKNQRLLQMTGLAMPSKPVNRVGAMAPAPQTKPKSSSTTLPESFGLGKMKVKKKIDESNISLNPEDALTKIPKGANPDDYEPRAIVRNVKGVPTEIYVANKKPEVIAANKKQDTMRIEAETQEKEVNAMIDSVWSKAEELIPAQKTGRAGVIKGIERSYRASGIGRFFSGGEGDKEQTGEKARAYKDYQLGTLSLLIRSLGEKGVLTDQDIKRSKEFEPKFGDSITLRNTKREAMREFLKSKLKAHSKVQGLQAKVEEQSSSDPEYDKYLQSIGQ